MENTAEKYKLSEIGLIPVDWKVERFDRVFELLPTNSFSRENLTDKVTKNKIQNIHYGDIHAKFKNEILDCKTEILPYIKDEVILNQNFNFIKDGDLIIADASEDYSGVGECVEVLNTKNKKIASGLHTFLARDNSGLTSIGFRTYIFSNPKVNIELKKIATGISVFSISKGNLQKLKIPIPPLCEQYQIAQILSTWDNAIDICKTIISQLERRNKELAKQLLFGKIRVNKFDRKNIFHNTDFGLKIPNDWKICSVADVFKERFEKSSNQKDFPLYSLTIEKGLTEKTDRYERSFLLKDLENNEYRLVYKNDILFNPMNLRFGAIALSNVESVVSVSAYYNVITKSSKIVNEKYYLNLFQTDKFISFYDRISIGSLIEKKRVHLSNFLKLQIPLPIIDEQNKIIEIIDESKYEINKYYQKLQKLQLQKKGLMQQLLTGKIRVKIN